jgi:hypothetical protein
MKAQLRRSIVTLALAICAVTTGLVGCATHDMDGMQAAGGGSADRCIVCGDKLGKETRTVSYNSQDFKTCCKDCADKFNADPAKYAAKAPQPK